MPVRHEYDGRAYGCVSNDAPGGRVPVERWVAPPADFVPPVGSVLPGDPPSGVRVSTPPAGIESSTDPVRYGTHRGSPPRNREWWDGRGADNRRARRGRHSRVGHHAGGGHRRVRRWSQHGGARAGERRLLRGGQPAAGADAGHGRAGVRRPAARPGVPRWCSTCAAAAFSTDLAGAVRALRERGFSPRVLFVDADDEVLIRRFENVRRSHPLQGDGRLADGIAAERELLAEAREQRRRGHRHQPPQRQPAAAPGSRSCSAARTPAGCG